MFNGYLLPTGTCFDDALDNMEKILRYDAGARYRVFVVHALVDMDDGKICAHAWLEDRDQVIFDGWLSQGDRDTFSCPQSEYYAELKPRSVKRYSVDEIYRLNAMTRHYGPWEEPYLSYVKKREAAHSEN